MTGEVLNMSEIHKINGSVRMSRSEVNPATAHTLDRCMLLQIRVRLIR